MKTCIVDIDGTISDSRHRLHFVTQRPKDYEAFHSLCHEDMPIAAMTSLVSSLQFEARIVLVTGRPISYLDITCDWLDINGVIYDELYMRPAGDTRPAPIFKLEVLRTLQAKGHDVFLAIEDQQNVVDMWRANGVHCLQTEAV